MVRMGYKRVPCFAVLILASAVAFAETDATVENYKEYYEQGEFALRVEKWDRAIELFSKALEGNPQLFEAYYHRAIAYSKKGEYDKSIGDLKKAVELKPDYAGAYLVIGLIYEIKKDYPAALKYYREALGREKDPSLRKIVEKYLQDAEAKARK
jgi:tetratricopeptide (TPR) repeat protein